MGYMDAIGRFLISLYSLLFPPTDTARVVEQSSLESLGLLVSPLTIAEHSVALLPYRHTLVRALIIETKFHKNQKAIGLFAEILAEYLHSFIEDRASFTKTAYVLVPIPLAPLRQKERGYNQIEEVIKKTTLPYDGSVLERVRETKPQTSLRREARLQNIMGAFRVCKPLTKEVVYIVVDDVTTTGATLLEACAELRKAGATEVYGIALAH